MAAARKQSGDRASRLAGKYLRELQAEKVDDRLLTWIVRRDLKTLCASVLSQDETKGARSFGTGRNLTQVKRRSKVRVRRGK